MPAARSGAPATSRPTVSRSLDTAPESASVRAGASPIQNGMVGGWPPASSTRIRSDSTRRMRQEWSPSWKMSPGRVSIAKSSFRLPITVPAGSRTTA